MSRRTDVETPGRGAGAARARRSLGASAPRRPARRANGEVLAAAGGRDLADVLGTGARGVEALTLREPAGAGGAGASAGNFDVGSVAT